jgi:ribose-phosphate pyrophosphokinase
MNGITVFSGSAHKAFAAEVCTYLQTPLSPSDLHRFATDCLQIQLQENCRQRDVFLIQPLSPPTQELTCSRMCIQSGVESYPFMLDG